MKAVLALKDGTVLHGAGFGAEGERTGELVFNTSMTGYQEALTDPSYGGQILLMTYPLIGNYGVNAADNESSRVHARGFVVRELSPDFQHRSAEGSVDSFLKKNGTPGITGVDTRFLVRRIRSKGVMPAIIAASVSEIDVDKLVGKMEGFDYSATDYVAEASTKEKKVFGEGDTLEGTRDAAQALRSGERKKVALLDFGVKMGIVRELVKRGCEVHVLPAYSSAAEVKEIEPDGIMLSNGPGDPAVVTGIHKTVKELAGCAPMFGVCLGHQVLAHAFGGNTFKLKFGHRGSNHPVLDLERNKVAITTQNHGFAVDKIPEGFELTHRNLNDGSVEGMRNKELGIFSVQYHPEASPGPHDSGYLFDKFVEGLG
jgi:carbamoyl-phosphate synthase small subunit